MKTLVIGSGGREHALVWRLAQSPSVSCVFAAPGNPGAARHGHCLPVSHPSPTDYLRIAESNGIDLTIVGPEAPLMEGLVDAFRQRGRAIVGPTLQAARLEGSKLFAKEFLKACNLPTARFIPAFDYDQALRALDSFALPVVLKADGLAGGKGVLIPATRQDAEIALSRLFSGELVGSAGSKVIIEEYLTGEEVSFILLTDGVTVLPLEPTQDHKAVNDGDSGPNTGGMGAYCDSRILAPADTARIMREIVEPVVRGLADRGTPFTGFLYVGLMMTATGPQVLEFNVRLGDPEAQALLHRLDCDFGEVLLAAASGKLSTARLRWKPDPSVCLVLAAHGYPGPVRTGDLIRGIELAEERGATVFHAGTRLGPQGLQTAGGRVLGVTHSGATLQQAIANTYSAADPIRFEGMHFRRDIGRKGLARW